MQIEVDSHTHTIASGHAYSTLADNLEVAARQGIKLMASTDHGPAMPDAPHFWHFVNLKVIPRIMNGVAILRGVEANITNSRGDLDLEDDLLDQMDIVLASLHSPIIGPASRAENTEAVVKAICSKKIDIFCHGGNPIFPIDCDEVARSAAEHDVLIEINNSSFTTSRAGSKKNCERLAEAVAVYGGYLTFGSDAHIAQYVGGFEHCSALVERVGFPGDRLLCSSASKFTEYLQSKRKNIDYSEIVDFLR